MWDSKAAQASTGGLLKSSNDTLCLGVGSDNENFARPRLETCIKDAGEAKIKGQAWAITKQIKNVSPTSTSLPVPYIPLPSLPFKFVPMGE